MSGECIIYKYVILKFTGLLYQGSILMGVALLQGCSLLSICTREYVIVESDSLPL